MPWTHVLACWPHLLSQLCNDFRYLELSALRRFKGDRVKMELYLAETHDLTVSEAQAALEDWLTYKGVHVVQNTDKSAA